MLCWRLGWRGKSFSFLARKMHSEVRTRSPCRHAVPTCERGNSSRFLKYSLLARATRRNLLFPSCDGLGRLFFFRSLFKLVLFAHYFCSVVCFKLIPNPSRQWGQTASACEEFLKVFWLTIKSFRKKKNKTNYWATFLRILSRATQISVQLFINAGSVLRKFWSIQHTKVHVLASLYNFL